MSAAESSGIQQPPSDNLMTALRQNLEQTLQLPPDAVDWLCALFDAIQTFDDYADGATVSRERLDALIWHTLAVLPGNPWFLRHAGALLPVVALQVLKWQGSDAEERGGNPSAMAYAWRAGFYDLVLLAVSLCHGPAAATNAAPIVMRLYGESFEDYRKEFDHA